MKLKLALSVISILIIAVPLSTLAVLSSGNFMDTVVTPSIKDAFSSGLSSQTQLYPQATDANYYAQNSTVSFTFTFTNPLNINLKVYSITSNVTSTDDKWIAYITLDNPTDILPHQTAELKVSGTLQTGVTDYLTQQVAGGASSLDLVFENLDVSVGGLTVHRWQVDAGSLPLGGAV
jgi:hypothetical protein